MTNAYPLTVNTSRPLRKVDDFSALATEQKLSFLYIGSKVPGYISAHFITGILANNYSEAKAFFIDYGKTTLPDVIFIDEMLIEKELADFCSFLKAKNLFNDIVIIYNDQKLDESRIYSLKKNELVDDAMNFSSSVNYFNKISFLKKMKSRSDGRSAKLSVHRFDNKAAGMSVKRGIDIFFALSALIILSPLFLLIALIIRVESKGPVFYAAKRAGKGFKIFKFYKFRTMVEGADKKIVELEHLNQYADSGCGAKFLKLKDDPRVTKVGKILRQTSLDELPQFINVLAGDMSIVGNRPLPLYEASTLTTNDFVERFVAPAGITGLWQIKKRDVDMTIEERMKLDIDYARKANPILDLWIMAKTPTALFQKTSA